MQELAIVIHEFRFDPAKAHAASEETILCRLLDNRIRMLARGNARRLAMLDRLGRMKQQTEDTHLPDDIAAEAEVRQLVDELRKRHDQTQKSIRAVLNVGDQDEGFMAEELKRLNGELKSLAHAIREIEAQPTHAEPMELNRVAEALRAVDPVWDVLFAEEQQRIIQLLVEDITVSTSGIDIRFRTNGIEQIVDELQPIEERAHA